MHERECFHDDIQAYRNEIHRDVRAGVCVLLLLYHNMPKPAHLFINHFTA